MRYCVQPAGGPGFGLALARKSSPTGSLEIKTDVVSLLMTRHLNNRTSRQFEPGQVRGSHFHIPNLGTSSHVLSKLWT